MIFELSGDNVTAPDPPPEKLLSFRVDPSEKVRSELQTNFAVLT